MIYNYVEICGEQKYFLNKKTYDANCIS